MIIKIDGLTAAEFASLSVFLASEENIIKEAYVVEHSLVNSPGCPSAMFARLVTSKAIEGGKHNVVLQMIEEFTGTESEEVFIERRKIETWSSCPNRENRQVPAHYLLGLLQATGRFPDGNKV